MARLDFAIRTNQNKTSAICANFSSEPGDFVQSREYGNLFKPSVHLSPLLGFTNEHIFRFKIFREELVGQCVPGPSNIVVRKAHSGGICVDSEDPEVLIIFVRKHPFTRKIVWTDWNHFRVEFSSPELLRLNYISRLCGSPYHFVSARVMNLLFLSPLLRYTNNSSS